MKRKKKKKDTLFWIFTIILFITYIISNYETDYTYSISDNTTNLNDTTEVFIGTNNDLYVYFIDVGQADSILIRLNNHNMLIDAGNNEDGRLLVDYFKSLGIDSFDYVVGTHPHEDHIGGMDDIINNFTIETIYLPDAYTTTVTFEEVLDAISNNNLTYKVPIIDSVFYLEDAIFKVIYTGTDTDDLNNTSIVLKMSYGNTSFLFTGDATSKTEKLILSKDIQSIVLKVGHHGSSYSSSDSFLKKVNPKYAVISVGFDNSYKHPSEVTINKLNKYGIEIYRTDTLGTILFKSDGKNINISNFKTNTNGG